MSPAAGVRERAAALAAAGTPFVHATVVRAEHPTSAHAGDAALVHPDGRIEGFVGGTCAEESVRVHSLSVLTSGEPLLLRIVAGDPATTSERGVVTVANPCLSGGALDVFLEPRRPPPRLRVVGETPIAVALAALAEPLGFAVVPGPGTPEVTDAGLVVASHGRDEEPALTAALRAGVPYVALVASRRRAAAVLAALDVPEEQRARVSSPAGLDLGGRTAGEIALSILAELVQERARGRPEPDAPPPVAATVDPVCGMTVAPGPSTPHVEQDGDTVWFCSPHCRTAYVADR